MFWSKHALAFPSPCFMITWRGLAVDMDSYCLALSKFSGCFQAAGHRVQDSSRIPVALLSKWYVEMCKMPSATINSQSCRTTCRAKIMQCLKQFIGCYPPFPGDVPFPSPPHFLFCSIPFFSKLGSRSSSNGTRQYAQFGNISVGCLDAPAQQSMSQSQVQIWPSH